MQLIIQEIRSLTKSLEGLRSDNIIVENLNSILVRLKASELSSNISRYKGKIPTAPVDDLALAKQLEGLKEEADLINKEADFFLDELERIKTMRQTLNLEALDPVIKEARKIIHSLHAFTAALEEGS